MILPGTKNVCGSGAAALSTMSRFGLRRASAKEKVPEGDADLVTASRAKGFRDIASDPKVSPICSVQVEHHSAKNYKGNHENEDRWIDHHDADETLQLDFHMVGVLDGHDTESASDLVSRLLPAAVSKRLKEGSPLFESYADAMAEMEESLKKVHASAGTCVNSCTIAGRFVWCANLGDCRSALVPLQAERGSAGGPKAAGIYWMSQDHKASSPSEMRRIKAAGGTVVDGRVEGLEPSRTLGDFDVKTSTKKGVISIIPEVRCFELGDGRSLEHAILVCGTDGVWDVLSAQDICDLIHARKDLAKLMDAAASGKPVTPALRRPLRDLAEDVVQFAVAKGSMDDCTCVATLITAHPAGSASKPPI